MKINIFRTNNQFLEEPIRLSVCNKASEGTSVTEIAEVDFGKYYFDCLKSCNNGCRKTAEIRTTPYNKELDCNCC